MLLMRRSDRVPGKSLWLGTSLWGWGVDERTAHALLDKFAENEGGVVDAATNYPINGRPENFGRANAILSGWLRSNPGSGIKVFCKVGSLDNSGSSDANLNGSSVLLTAELLRGSFSDDLWGVGIHWDNRHESEQISQTLDAMARLRAEGLEIGFSGVQRPDLYAGGAPELGSDWWVEVKENAATCEARLRYSPHFPMARYVAYGINMGGVKLENTPLPDSSLAKRGLSEPPIATRLRKFLSSSHSIEPRPETLNELALLMTWANAELSGLIVGPRNSEQLAETMRYWSALKRSGSDLHMREILTELVTE